ncbi:MAG: hypothetical protein COU31_04395 [Candidatus Magasanikbacteria bacterium CG10_big_fil_rev_8_21_14_0_10_40_10]|uniref:HTH arsR-type domain-containing protein n=1 Tax=Candidatus Magasanikbacteria bacterium CG10_big_fil_rev_8_21_14_0_10_40_10 TaxID=1974648 RepID=A0A2M6W311_9BACT|nr:MAG: hypothetical protein COU31_04395 [Candidatus Magasanikbacteria bacterium CG10_big_fil_rev_8_21_14_0_10_40_10]
MIEQLFGSKTRVNLLYLLFGNPTKLYFVREMSRAINVQLNAVRREIANLEKIGLIHQVKKKPVSKADAYDFVDGDSNARAKFYALNTGSLLYPELKSLLQTAQVLKEREMIEDLKQKAGNIKLMILSGVFMQGAQSPTDILIVGQVKPQVLSKSVKNFEKRFGKSVRYTVMSEKEFEERKEIGDKFLYSILECNHLVVVDNY